MEKSSFVAGAVAALGFILGVADARAAEPVYSFNSGGYSLTVSKAPGGGTTATQHWSSGAGPLNGKTIVSTDGSTGSSRFSSHSLLGSNGRVERTWGQQSTTSYSPSRTGRGTDYVTRTSGRDYFGRNTSSVSQGTLRSLSLPAALR